MLLPFPYFDVWHRYAWWVHGGVVVLVIVLGCLPLCLAKRFEASAMPQAVCLEPPHHSVRVAASVQPAPMVLPRASLACHVAELLALTERHGLQWQGWVAQQAPRRVSSVEKHQTKSQCWEVRVAGDWRQVSHFLSALSEQGYGLPVYAMQPDQSSRQLQLQSRVCC